MIRALASAALVLATTTPAAAQTLVLCDADWVDVARIRALITVEVPESDRYVFRVTECAADSALVQVGLLDAEPRERNVGLLETPPEARSRLVALVAVELARLSPPPTAEEEPADAEVPPAAPPESAEAENAALTDAETTPAVAPPDTPSPEPTPDEEGAAGSLDPPPPELAEPAPTAPRAPSPRPSLDEEVEIPPDHSREDAESPPALQRSKWSIGLGFGGAFHHLQLASDGGLMGQLALRFRARWKALVWGLRVTARPPVRGDVRIRGFGGFLGAELASVWWRKSRLIFGAHGELGFGRFRQSSPFGICDPAFGCVDLNFDGRRATYGVLGTFRVERAFRRTVVSFELEAGWMKGFVLGVLGEPITGAGGLMLGGILEVSFAGGEQ